MSDHDTYRRWIELRQHVDVPVGFVDDTMHRAEKVSWQRAAAASSPGLLDVVATSRLASFAVCSAAMLIGLLPFIYVAYAARLISF